MLLGVGQARVHRQQRQGVAQARIVGIELARVPQSLRAQKQALTSGHPGFLLGKLTAGRKNIGVFFQGIARDQAARGVCAQLVGRNGGLAHLVGIEALGASSRHLVAYGVDLLTHGVAQNHELTAIAGVPSLPRLSVQGGNPVQRQAKPHGQAFGGGHANTNAGEGAGATTANHASKRTLVNRLTREQLLNAGKELGIGGAERRRLQIRDEFDGACSAIELPQAHRDDLVGGIDGKHEVALAGTLGRTVGIARTWLFISAPAIRNSAFFKRGACRSLRRCGRDGVRIISRRDASSPRIWRRATDNRPKRSRGLSRTRSASSRSLLPIGQDFPMQGAFGTCPDFALIA